MPDDAAGTAIAPSVGGDTGSSGPAETSPSPSEVEEQPGTPVEGGEPAEPEAAPEPGTEAETTPEGEQAEGDGRVLPKWVRALKDVDPEGYKRAKTDFFDLHERRSDFPTVAAARKAKQTLDIVGGEAGLAEMQADNAEFTSVAKQFVAGGPEFFQDLFKQDPIAAAQHVPHALDALAEHDRGSYNRLIAKQFAQEFAAQAINGETLYSVLERIYRSLPEGEGSKEAKAQLNAIAAWHNRITELAKQEENPEVKKLRDKIRADEEARNKESQTTFVKAYREKAEKFNIDTADKLLEQFLGSRKMDPDAKNLAKHNLIQIADQYLMDGKTFPEFMKQRDLLFQRGDETALLRYVNSAWKQALEMSIKRVMRLVGGGAPAPKSGVAPKPAGQPPAKSAAVPGFVKVNQRPDPRMIDRNKTTANMIASEKRAVMKDGSKISWAHL